MTQSVLADVQAADKVHKDGQIGARSIVSYVTARCFGIKTSHVCLAPNRGKGDCQTRKPLLLQGDFRLNCLMSIFPFQHDAASQYDKANRRELADKERLEAKILQKLLPPALTDSQIDETLNKAIASLPISQPSLGQIFKSFYALVDKSECPPDALKRRLQELGLASTS